ncbi:unnamed protein product [Kluyveromyces dobzhanskii CBS 2104]|uniref:Polynucleotide 5'-hydroxyl-kinase GRC3 n=1 Tax=Kluyveromyces dobzhanskii CBS 2104 TaxID=1427455 RepID=A0A0A8L7G1_9SACH|nr:unnamed protein product [Kluyveromyces dobzhanskii CBS 2104]
MEEVDQAKIGEPQVLLRTGMSDDIFKYSSNSDSDDSDAEQKQSAKLIKKPSETPVVEIYDEDGDDDENDDETRTLGSSEICQGQLFSPVYGLNFFTISGDCSEILICLKKNQHVLLCGQFNMQVVKGGITYNNVHYNCSWRKWELSHPICNAISPIVASFYAGWESKSFLGEKYQRFKEQLEIYECVLRISSGCNITELTKLSPDLRDIWGPLNSCLLPGIAKDQLTFNIITQPSECVRVLNISDEWSRIIDEMHIFHTNSSQDMRVMVIGGKNSGKSTLMRLLIQKFLHSGKDFSDEVIHYLDIDPGQPEYSSPECISWNKVDAKSLTLGQHLCQGKFTTVKQHFLGSSSPQDWPESYSNAVESMLKLWQEENFMGTSFINIPGWIKGFGIRIINHALERFKPTHIIFLSHNGLQFSSEIIVPDTFTTIQRSTYKPVVMQIHSPPVEKHISHALQRFNAAKIRQFKITAYFHKTFDRNFLITPLVMQKPRKISIGGSSGIVGVHFLQTLACSLHHGDIKLSLEGTIVALHRTGSVPDVFSEGSVPVIKDFQGNNTEFVGLGLIHSIDLEQLTMYIFVPDFIVNAIMETENDKWIIVRGKTETPICEIYPTNGIFKSEANIPYLSLFQKKRHEHVWKVRKNVMRRGQRMK